MNAQQRDFLVKHVTAIFKGQVDDLEAKLPKRPSLNNHIISALLDNSLQFHPAEEVREKLRKRAKSLDRDSELIEMVDRDEVYGYNRGRHSRYSPENEEEVPIVRMIAEDLFVMPPAYQEAVKEYDDKTDVNNKQIAALTSQHNTIVMKIRIGSAKQLEALVTQVDNMGNLDLIAGTLMVVEPQKQLSK